MVSWLIVKAKRRYIVAECSGDVDISSPEMQRSLRLCLLKLFGSVGYSRLGYKFISRVEGNAFVARVARGQEKEFILALSFARGEWGGIFSIATSGTIKAALRNYKDARMRVATHEKRG